MTSNRVFNSIFNKSKAANSEIVTVEQAYNLNDIAFLLYQTYIKYPGHKYKYKYKYEKSAQRDANTARPPQSPIDSQSSRWLQ